MGSKGYTILGWITWQVVSRAARREIKQNRLKLGAAGVVLAVVIAGLLAGRSSNDD